MGDRVADGFLSLQKELTSAHKSLYGAGLPIVLDLLAPQLLKATGCECMKVWVYLMLHIPDRGDAAPQGLLVAVGDVFGVIDDGYEHARNEAAAATQLAMKGEKPNDRDQDASQVQKWADAMLVMTYGTCPDFKCPTTDKPTPVFTDSIMQMLGGAAKPKSRQGPYEFNKQLCYVVEFVSPVGPKGTVPVGSGIKVALNEQLKFVLRYVFCFYNYAPPNVPPSPTDPGTPRGKGPATGGVDPIPPPPPPAGPTTPADSPPAAPIGPTPSTGRGRRRRRTSALSVDFWASSGQGMDGVDGSELTPVLFAGTFPRKWPTSPWG